MQIKNVKGSGHVKWLNYLYICGKIKKNLRKLPLEWNFLLMALPLGNMSRARGHNPADTRRNNNVIMTSNDVATSFWRHNDVIITSCARWAG